jgi:hypothetical protein
VRCWFDGISLYQFHQPLKVAILMDCVPLFIGLGVFQENFFATYLTEMDGGFDGCHIRPPVWLELSRMHKRPTPEARRRDVEG